MAIVVGIAVFALVAGVVPGAACRDGTPSSAIGRRGACSHHGGVDVGWTWVGVPLGLFALVGALALLDRVPDRGRGGKSRRVNVVPVGTAMESVIRRAIVEGRPVSFLIRDASESGKRTVIRPGWLQMHPVAGLAELCLMELVPGADPKAWPLATMDDVRIELLTTPGT
ncbi:DUF3761 domain-containing protein [Luteibacter pinisoli]|uniref:DUF3761 domain-containing protein n=1 Tax=Luteibacter pinisoli TaxID=2589080 RepID=A0A4Y5Z601_9GAMM|nr:DUF3761 domain-containing protein [Luteibacter pinisoli]QDE39815.1 DUF3761 domain-containing protein [Luteibacter pinisoli]